MKIYRLSTILFYIFLLIIIAAAQINSQSNLDSLKNLLPQSNGKAKLKLLIKIGYYLSSDNPNEAIKYLDEAINLADNLNEKWSKADAVFNKGVAEWHLGKVDESSEHYKQAKQIYKEFNDSLSIVKVLNSEAINHQMKGEIDKAYEKFFQSLDLAKKIGDRPTIFNTLLNIGVSYDNNNDFENCLKYYLEALNYSDENDKASLSLLQNYIAEVYLTLKDFGQAEEYLDKAIVNSKATGDVNSLIWSYTNLGNLNFQKKNYSVAERNFKESLRLARQSDYKLEIIHALAELGKFYRNTDRFDEAKNLLNEALLMSKQLNSLQDLRNIYGELASLYSEMQDYKKAYEYHQIYKQASDSLFTISNNEKINELQTRYEVKTKEQETNRLQNENELQKKIIEVQKFLAIIISLLAIALIVFIWILFRSRRKIMKARDLLLEKNNEIEKHKEEISSNNETLEKLNATKDKFFSIIAHDLRNPIASFVNISTLFEEDYDKISDKDKREIIGHMNVSSKNLMRLLENLLTWSRLSSDKLVVSPEKIGLRDLLELSIEPLQYSAMHKNIKIILEIPSSIIIETDKFIFQAIIGNLVNNAIKFSKQGSDILIYNVSTESHYQLKVKDQGIGISAELMKDIFVLGSKSTRRGTNGEGGTGLGMILVKELVEKLEWEISVVSELNVGTEFTIKIPFADGL